MPRRKDGTLLPLENEILHMALAAFADGDACFYGFALAQAMRDDAAARPLVSHGTLYKALGRLEEFGLLTSRWEDVEQGERPRRRLYQLTPRGFEAARAAHSAPGATPRRRADPRLA
jgi:PadR family transcriptional regulator